MRAYIQRSMKNERSGWAIRTRRDIIIIHCDDRLIEKPRAMVTINSNQPQSPMLPGANKFLSFLECLSLLWLSCSGFLALLVHDECKKGQSQKKTRNSGDFTLTIISGHEFIYCSLDKGWVTPFCIHRSCFLVNICRYLHGFQSFGYQLRFYSVAIFFFTNLLIRQILLVSFTSVTRTWMP